MNNVVNAQAKSHMQGAHPGIENNPTSRPITNAMRDNSKWVPVHCHSKYTNVSLRMSIVSYIRFGIWHLNTYHCLHIATTLEQAENLCHKNLIVWYNCTEQV